MSNSGVALAEDSAQPLPKLGATPAPKARLLAFYLPQYHPISENDEFWGKGFTEWTNVAKAKPRFRGHDQPRLPADLGFYDLRVPEVREAQAKLARDHGVEGFCYWHYWFGNGRRILQRPLAEVLESGRPDFPFCMAWANESWTGIWHGAPQSTLIEQTYPGRDDERAHFEAVLPAFRDPRHVRVDGKPLFAVYKPYLLPEPAAFVAHWRHLATEAGLPGLYLVACGIRSEDPAFEAFDAFTTLPPNNYITSRHSALVLMTRALRERNFGRTFDTRFGDRLRRPARISYADLVKHSLSLMPADPRFLPCVMPNWDNTPRSGRRGVVVENSTPEGFRRYLNGAIAKVSERPPQHRIVFVKAWNEWAEGNYLEPDARYGHGFLEAVKAEVFG